MSGSVNKVILIGNLGRDPEIRNTQAGKGIANLRLATSERWKDKASGEWKEQTEWHTVVVYNEHLVSVCEKFLKKGSKVYLEGQLKTRKWQDKEGAERYSTEVVLQNFRGELTLLDPRKPTGDSGPSEYDPDQGEAAPARSTRRAPAKAMADMDDDIPF